MIVALMLGLAALPTITIDQTTEGYVAKIATFDVRQQAEVDAEIDRRAASVCADRDIHWGKFRSLTKIGKNPRAEPAPVTGYIKQFSCVAREQASYPAPPSDWKPTSADERDAVAVLIAAILRALLQCSSRACLEILRAGQPSRRPRTRRSARAVGG